MKVLLKHFIDSKSYTNGKEDGCTLIKSTYAYRIGNMLLAPLFFIKTQLFKSKKKD